MGLCDIVIAPVFIGAARNLPAKLNRFVRCLPIAMIDKPRTFNASAGKIDGSWRLFAGHHVLHDANYGRQDRAAGAAADHLADNRPDIRSAPGRARQ